MKTWCVMGLDENDEGEFSDAETMSEILNIVNELITAGYEIVKIVKSDTVSGS